jgi:HAD superfamily hydrolase (TIGR01509 family)
MRFSTEHNSTAAGGARIEGGKAKAGETGSVLTPVEKPSPSIDNGRLAHFEAVIFDMDGVIVDSEPLHEKAFQDVFLKLGYGKTHGMDFPSYYGRSDRALWEDFVAKHQPPQSLEELISLKQRRLIELLRETKPVFAGAEHLLLDLHGRYPLGLASGSVHEVIGEVLAMRDLRRFFRQVVSVQDVPRPKPFPDVFLRAAELLGIPPARCCVIEDSAVGTQAAVAAGMTVIAITNTLPAGQLAHAHHVVKRYEEIQALLARG